MSTMNLVPALYNTSKCAGVNFQLKFARHVFNERRWLSSSSKTVLTVDRLKKKDGVETKFQLIYKPLNGHLLSAGTSLCAFGSYVWPLFLAVYAIDPNAEQLPTGDLILMGGIATCATIAFFNCRRFPLRIYNHEQEYIAIMPGILPNINRKLRFVKGDLKDKKIKDEGIRKWFRSLFSLMFQDARLQFPTSYKLNDTSIYLSSKCFEKPIQLYEMFKNTQKYVQKMKRAESRNR